MTPLSRKLILSLRLDLLRLACAQYFAMNTTRKNKQQIADRLNQSQALTILSALSL